MSHQFESTGHEIDWQGAIVSAGTARYRYADGTEVRRDKVWHPGAVAVLAIDEAHIWLVRQPREVVGEPALLEIPAGKRDVPGERPLLTAKRELAEEIGMQASDWHQLLDFYTAPGFSDEHIFLFLATGLSPAGQVEHPEEDERIEILRWPLTDLAGAIAQCRDAKSLIALLWLAGGQDRA